MRSGPQGTAAACVGRRDSGRLPHGKDRSVVRGFEQNSTPEIKPVEVIALKLAGTWTRDRPGEQLKPFRRWGRQGSAFGSTAPINLAMHSSGLLVSFIASIIATIVVALNRSTIPGVFIRRSAIDHQKNLKPNLPSRRLSLMRITGPARGVHSRPCSEIPGECLTAATIR